MVTLLLVAVSRSKESAASRHAGSITAIFSGITITRAPALMGAAVAVT